MPVAERYWSKVDRSGGSGACWPWTAARHGQGYGLFTQDGKLHRAHRVAWSLTHGAIPKSVGFHGTCVLHRCDNPPCCNPEHLFLGTHFDNMRDMSNKGRAAQPDNRGERCYAAKLTAADVRQMRRLSAHGASSSDIAKAFDVSQPAAWRIINGQRWTHVL